MTRRAPPRRRAQSAAPDPNLKRARRSAWLLGGFALVFYVGYYLWNLMRSGAFGG